MRYFQLLLERCSDLMFGILGLLLVSIPLMIIALAIKLESKGSVFFRQERVGNGQQPRLVVH